MSKFPLMSIYQYRGATLTNRNPQYPTSLIISPSLSNPLLLLVYLALWMPAEGSEQGQDVDTLLFTSEVTVRNGLCLHLEFSSTCGNGADGGGLSLSTGRAILSGTSADEPSADGLLLCTVDEDERNLKPSGFTVKIKFSYYLQNLPYVVLST